MVQQPGQQVLLLRATGPEWYVVVASTLRQRGPRSWRKEAHLQELVLRLVLPQPRQHFLMRWQHHGFQLHASTRVQGQVPPLEAPLVVAHHHVALVPFWRAQPHQTSLCSPAPRGQVDPPLR